MKLEEAVEVLTKRLNSPFVRANSDTMEATKLGKEALEFLIRWRSKAEIQPFPLLRSESTD